MLIIIIFLTLLLLVQSQKAIVLSSSIGFYNYRQAANAITIYHHLRQNGFLDEDILLFTGQISACCQKNPLFGTVSFHDGIYNNIFSNIEQDYYYPEMKAQDIANIFANQYPPSLINKKRLTLSKDEPLFIFVTGHGGDYYFKMRQRQALLDEQFMKIFQTLQAKDITESVVLFSDSCSAITPFETIKMKNFMGFASSSFDEKSLSHGFDSQLNSPKSDDFTFYLDDFLRNQNSLKSQTFKDLQKFMDFQKLKVNAKMITNKFKKSQTLDKYMKRSKRGEYKKFKGKKVFQHLKNKK